MIRVYSYITALVCLILYCIFKEKYKVTKKKRTFFMISFIIAIIGFAISIIKDNIIIQTCMIYILVNIIYNKIRECIK